MSPKERADDYDQLWGQYQTLQSEVRRLKVAAGNVNTATKGNPSPRGSIDKRGVHDSGKVGMAGGLVGAWSDDINSHIELGVNAAGGSLKLIYSFTMVEDVVGFCVGFLVLGLATAFLKIVKNYG